MKHTIFICACLLMIIPGVLSIADGLWPDGLPKPPMNVDFYGQISVKGKSAPVGWILRAFDSNGIQCGEFEIGVEGTYGLLHAYGDDIYTPEDEGALPGELVIFKIWDTTGKAHIVRPNGLDIPIWSEDGDYKEIELMTKYGDMSGDGNVTAFDASIILRAVVGAIKFGPEERENADVTANGTVTALDAAAILQYTVGLIQKFPVEEAVQATPADIRSYALSIPNAIIHPGMKIIVPIVTDSTSGMLAAQLSLAFDSKLLKPVNAYLASSMTGYLLEYRFINDQLNIAIAGPRTPNDSGAIINVEFEVSDKINRNITSHIVLSRQLLNEGANVVVRDGSFKVLPAKTLMYPNYPNPFNPETWIPYQLAEESDVNIRIYDITGRLVYRVNLGNQNAGFYITKGEAMHWDGKDNAGEKVASGVYFYTLEAGRFRATRKMILMK